MPAWYALLKLTLKMMLVLMMIIIMMMIMMMMKIMMIIMIIVKIVMIMKTSYLQPQLKKLKVGDALLIGRIRRF